MERYTVTGMSCAACSARVEKAVSKVDGVSSCSVNLLTNSMNVEGPATEQAIKKAVEDAGYGLQSTKKTPSSNEDPLKDTETPILKRRLYSSLIFLIVLMYFSMGHMMWNFPIPSFFAQNHVAMGLLQLLLTGIVMVINQKFFVSGFKGLIHQAPNMDTLVALGSSAAFIYSTVVLFLMSDAVVKGNQELVMEYMHDLYFESSAMILTLITVGKMLETISKGRTTDAIKGLMKLAPKTATVLRDNKEVLIPIEDIQVGDIFIVKPGENIPVDGEIIEGNSTIDESSLTGESIPVDKTIHDTVSSATLNQTGFLQCKATRVGEDTTLSQIIQMVSDASATKAPIAKIADKVSGIFVPTVIGISIITFIVWMLAGKAIGYSLARAISVLVISCPCALGLATPVAIMVGNGLGAKNGIMFKTATSLEEAGKTQIIALDKTGTITNGKPKVTDIIPNQITEEALLKYAYALESKSEHPLAKAITSYSQEKSIPTLSVTNFTVLPGNGLKGTIEEELVQGGNASYIQSTTSLSKEIFDTIDSLSKSGKTPLLFSKGSTFLGIIAVADTIKEESPKAIQDLKKMGIKVVMLTGDNQNTANAIGKQVGVDEVIAGILPSGKEEVIQKLQAQGKVTMVGDGINDAPALTRADMGIAIGNGTDIAIDAADIVLMKSSLSDVPAAIRLSRQTVKNIHENLFWAFFYNCIGIPLAAGVWIPLFHLELNPMFGAAAMSLSSFCVVTNALRLNLCKIYDDSKDKKISHKKGGEDTMEKTMKIEGMMCGHCEARVKKALETLPQVSEAKVSHENGTAVVTLKEVVSNEILEKAVTDQDYTVTSIQ